MTDLSQIKNEIRKQALALRDSLAPNVRSEYSLRIVEYFSGFCLEDDDVISAFLPIRSEVDLEPLMETLFSKNVQVCLPFMLDQKTIEFRAYDKETELVDNGFGTKAPNDKSQVLDPTVMLVPLSAFDANGGRIGYSAGYYDRAIAKLRALGAAPKLIGVAFTVQQVAEVPMEAHDVRLDMVLTEHGLHSF